MPVKQLRYWLKHTKHLFKEKNRKITEYFTIKHLSVGIVNNIKRTIIMEKATEQLSMTKKLSNNKENNDRQYDKNPHTI